MKKITLTLLIVFIAIFGYAQTYSTGQVNLTTGFTVQFDVTNTTVTMTMVGPSDRWLGVAVSNTSYSPGGSMGQFFGDDIFYYSNGAIVDAVMPSLNTAPNTDASQDWSVSSNTTSGGNRTVVATRDRDTGDVNDYSFPLANTSAVFIWALGGAGTNNSFAYHFGGRGATMGSFTLSTNNDLQLQTFDFTISPNPSASLLNVDLTNFSGEKANIEVYDQLGRRILNATVNEANTSFNVGQWNSGIYLVKLQNTKGSQIKRFVKQ